MREYLLVGGGGFLGAVLRYAISAGMQRWTLTFPWSTLSINVLGCLLIGILMPVVEGRPSWLLFLVPGLLGGFTTFSAFGYEAWRLLQGGGTLLAALYVAGSVGMGLGAVWLGRVLGLMLK